MQIPLAVIGIGFIGYGGFLLAKFLKESGQFSEYEKAKASISEVSNGDVLQARLKVVQSSVITAPFSGSSCVYYKTQLQEFGVVESHRQGHHRAVNYGWKTVEEKSESVPFILSDGIGNIGVDLKKTSIEVNAKNSIKTRENETAQGVLGSYEKKERRLEWLISPGEEMSLIAKIDKRGSLAVAPWSGNKLSFEPIQQIKSGLGRKQKNDRTLALEIIGAGTIFLIFSFVIN